jgi:hypothetical protein
MRAKPCIIREVIKAIAAGSVTFRPDGLPSNAVPIAIVTPRISVTNLNRFAGAVPERFCSRLRNSCLSDIIGIE